MIAREEQAKSAHAGCYSIEYSDPSDSDWRFSMDYNRQTYEYTVRNRWTCSESPTSYAHWTFLQGIPEHAYRAFLNHFGLEEYEISLEKIMTVNPSPADVAHIRRAKEDRCGLERMVIKNMRTGCQKGELADTFEAR